MRQDLYRFEEKQKIGGRHYLSINTFFSRCRSFFWGILGGLGKIRKSMSASYLFRKICRIYLLSAARIVSYIIAEFSDQPLEM